jgi:hypothetical protein
MLPPAVLWIDPGGQTGIAAYQSQRKPLLPLSNEVPGFVAAELDFQEACGEIDMICASWQGLLAIGWERFTITSTTHKKTPQPEAMHVIGVCRYLADKYGCRVLPEAQQATPSAAEQEQLKALKWWVPGKNDAQSAAGHMLRYLVRANELPPREREILSAIGR